mgnify:CR=1 FL=1
MKFLTLGIYVPRDFYSGNFRTRSFFPRNFQPQKFLWQFIFRVSEKLFYGTENLSMADNYPFLVAIDIIYIIFRFVTAEIYMCMAE